MSSLRSIQSIRLLVPGPDRGLRYHTSLCPWQEICEHDLQYTEYRIKDVLPAQITRHPYFMISRIRTWGNRPPADAPPLHDQLDWLKFWLWHMQLPDFRTSSLQAWLGLNIWEHHYGIVSHVP
jgi:hypothetical protein